MLQLERGESVLVAPPTFDDSLSLALHVDDFAMERAPPRPKARSTSPLRCNAVAGVHPITNDHLWLPSGHHQTFRRITSCDIALPTLKVCRSVN